ncbi:hypothetical protein [Mariniflexile sp. HMF6888]|uniref:hypothetical protein n=1 Tax=Mariniflexile sp. HMF6888 TaxID=3373086 RepID=UPI0037A54F88
MENLTYWKIIIDLITSLGSISAVIIAILAIRFATKTSNHQILVSKVEEIYEITQHLLYYYPSLIFVYNRLNESHNSEKYNAEERSSKHKKYQKLVEQFKKNVDTEDLYRKTGRLRTLAQAYLSPELKRKVLTYNDLFEKLIIVILQEQKILQEIFYKEGFPEEKLLREFAAELEICLIKIIKLGEKPLSQNDIAEYRSKEFKQKLDIK